jgi:hypothetical protein
MTIVSRVAMLVIFTSSELWSQAQVRTDTGKPSHLQVDAMDPLGFLVGGAEFRLLDRSEVFSSEDVLEVPPGSYRLEVTLSGIRTVEKLTVAPGENHFLVFVPLLSVTDLPAYTFELLFIGLRQGCSRAVIERLPAGRSAKVSIPISGGRAAVGPLDVGMYTVLFYSKESVCGIGAFVAQRGGKPVRIVVLPVDQGSSEPAGK